LNVNSLPTIAASMLQNADNQMVNAAQDLSPTGSGDLLAGEVSMVEAQVETQSAVALMKVANRVAKSAFDILA